MADQPNKLSESDLLLIQSAQQNVISAQSIFEFTRNHLSRVYALGAEDQMNIVTGEITRIVPDTPGQEP